MSKQYVEIEEPVYSNLEKMAEENGFTSVEKFLTAISEGFCSGCSVTVLKHQKDGVRISAA